MCSKSLWMDVQWGCEQKQKKKGGFKSGVEEGCVCVKAVNAPEVHLFWYFEE